MLPINFVHRECAVAIEIGDRETVWDVTIVVAPLDGVELTESFGVRKLKFPKMEELASIRRDLIDEVKLAIERRLVVS